MSPVRILVADDEASILQVCMRALERQGYEVSGVSNGEQAVAAVRAGGYDVLITDIRMRGMTGLEACRAIREFDADIPIVVMTGFGSMESAIEALELGAAEFVLKPFRPAQLVAAVTRAIEKRRLYLENARLKALIPLFDLSQVFMSSVDPGTITREVVRIARQETRADSASLMLRDQDDMLTIRAAEGLPPEVILATHQRIDEGIAGRVIAERTGMILQGDLSDDPHFASRGEPHIASAISAPVIHKERVLGVLNISRTSSGPAFTQADLELVSVLASQAAVALENARLFAELEDAYRRLSELDHLKSEFIGIASHELRHPLAVLLAYAGLLESEATGTMREHLALVVESAMQLKTIIDEMVSLRRIDTGEAQVTLQSIDVMAAIRAAVDDLRALAEAKALQLNVQLPAVLSAAWADDQVVRLVLSSLLSNAIKFTPAGGSVTVSAEETPENVVVAVADTGIGIPENELERIFQRFYQVESSLRREHEGVGLGLAIAREMTDLLDGRITVESKVGKGSVFRLWLRKADHQARV